MRISAKDLGWLKESSFCPRCFWIERHMKGLPYQRGFPGIFSSIDTYTKHIVEKYFERNGELPQWLEELGEIKRIVNIKPSEFKTVKGNMIFTGIPDLLFQRPDDSFVIADYKTAKYTGTQDEFMPVYQIQLNGYAYISEALGNKPVKDLFLIYFEPPYREKFDELSSKHTTNGGFEMPFIPKIHRIKKDTGEVERLLEKADKIYSSEDIPIGLEDCKDCKMLEELIELVK